MNTNQTIDGVPRDLLQKITDGGYCHQGLMDRLRALLDAPAVQWLAMELNGKTWVIKEGPNADKWRAMGYELLPVETVAQPQVDAVTFPRELSDELAELIAEKARVCGGGVFEIWEAICEQFGKPASQPQGEPVEVVLPEFEPAFEKWWEEDGQYCRAGGGSYEKTFAYRAYEAALADVTRLNTK